jgi:hypothetical protein
LKHRKPKIKRWELIVLAIVALAFVGFVIMLEVHWRDVERSGAARYLRSLWRAWQRDGSPDIFDPSKYGYTTAGTTYIYTASVALDGQTASGLLAFHRYRGEYHGTFVITRAGQVVELDSDGRIRRHVSK